MSYYDPLYPIIQNTRNEIQSSILALQEKLKQRKQLDYDIQNIMQEEALRSNLPPPHHELPPFRDPNAESQLRYQNYVQDKMLADKLRYARQEEDTAFAHIKSMDLLGKQKLQLSRQRLREQYLHQLSEEERLKKRLHNLYDDDETLIRKYQDGTKMKEYNHELESYSNTRRNLHESPQKFEKPVNRSLAHEFKSESVKKFESSGKVKKPSLESGYKRSPYARLNMETDIKNESPQKNEFYMQKISGRKNEENNFSKRSFDNIKLQKRKRQLEEPERSPYYREEKRSKSTKRLNKSKTKSRFVDKSRSRSIIRSVEADAIKKIQNRLKLSQIVYEDSKFRNIKHEMSHLSMTYENEAKARKDIKDKLNNHPLILKKHAMVVE